MTPSENMELKARITALEAENARCRDALQNLSYYVARISPPPYGHKCRWCSDCVQRAKDDARAALAASPPDPRREALEAVGRRASDWFHFKPASKEGLCAAVERYERLSALDKETE